MSTLVAKGAEACLYLENWYEHQVIRKHRIPKRYRLPQLDHSIRNGRTTREARLISAARRAGVRTPIIFLVDAEDATIIMEYIEGELLKELMPKLSSRKRRKIFHTIGTLVARLHLQNLSHGDLTTSNMIIQKNGHICLVDFGLAAVTNNFEDFGTDLHLFRRALQSTHYTQWTDCYEQFQKGYKDTFGEKALTVFNKIRAIESRGRYITERIR